MKKALVIGATGLVGKKLVEELLKDPLFVQVMIFVRKKTSIKHHKLVEVLTDFNDLSQVSKEIKGDILFSCLGTTLSKAKTKDNQWAIDYNMQIEFAKIAEEKKVKQYALISSIGANSESNNFYLNMKGKIEEKIKTLTFDQIGIFRPSSLVGEREEYRWKEKVGIPLTYFFAMIPGFKKYYPIQDIEVANSMIQAMHLQEEKFEVYENLAMIDLAKEYLNENKI